ncbi:MAG: SDR family NAD(P)-dependent oxidoreductase, partial [Flavisolibacter sp.]|nr:SDR family NAD(P)-dependent oxidoreductase [Flavisolibacter sp.]
MAKVWMITGASSGIGQTLSQALLNAGEKVAGTFRNEEQARAFTQQSDNSLGVIMDVTNAEQIGQGVQQIVNQWSTIDVLVNNAGFGIVGGIEEVLMEEARQV